VLRPAAVLAERGASGAVRIRAADGGWDRPPGFLKPFDSMLIETADPRRPPELLVLRERIRSWRPNRRTVPGVEMPRRQRAHHQ
jgi:predicted ATPase